MSDQKIRVGVSGCAGRMGSHVVEAVQGAEDMEYVGGADPACSEESSSGVICTQSLMRMLETVKPDVVVDFTIPETVFENAKCVLQQGIPCVIGTTGLTEDQRTELHQLSQSKAVGVLVAPNFAVGAVLMMQFARQAARHFSGVEIIELHHDKKLDAPSGTALMTAQKMAETWRGTVPAHAQDNPARGTDADGIRVHSVRLPGLVAHQEVLFGNAGEALTIRHDSFDRKSFMPGVLLGIREIRKHTGLVFGLEHFLFD